MTVLYRKYRPQKLSEIVGQTEITTNLLKQLEAGKIAHAYLFSGPRGTGKTSTARIIAKAVNCKNSQENKFAEPCGKCESCLAISEGRFLDLIEIDAASNRGIDEIRELREKIGLTPTEGKFKVYLIDEVHMLTNEAFNALLKTLEEPPTHAIFILATTEPQKIPATILSRVQRFSFKRPNVEEIVAKLAEITKAEKAQIQETSLIEIAKAADGAFRDAEVLLDEVLAVNPKANLEEVRKIVGRAEGKNELLSLLINKETKKALEWLDEAVKAGANPRLLAEAALENLRAILLIKEGVSAEIIGLKKENLAEIENFAEQLTQAEIIKWVGLFTNALVDLRNASIPQLPLELAIVEACGFETKNETTELKTEEVKTEEVVPVEVTKKEISEEAVKIEIETPVVPEEIVKKHDNLVPVAAGTSLKKVLAAWETILKELKPKNNSLEIFLRGAQPKELDDDVLVIEFGYSFHKDRLEEPKNRTIVEEIISKAIGKPVKIKGTVGAPKPRVKKEEVKEETDPVEVFGKID